MRVVAGVIARRGRVLAARRGPGMRHAGRWEFPGGKVEAGEADAAALARELMEELRLEVAVGERLVDVVLPRGSGELHLVFYACTAEAEPRCTEHDAVRWLSGAALWDVDWQEADRPALPAIARWLAEGNGGRGWSP